MEALIPWAGLLAPLINFILIPMYRALQSAIDAAKVELNGRITAQSNDITALRNENAALSQRLASLQVVFGERISELEVQLHRDFCRREFCDKLKSDLARTAEGRH